MGHSHSHGHDDQTTFYVEQIFTIAVCGAIGGVCMLLYLRGQALSGMLSPDQHLRVLFGGIGLLILVLIRAAYVWIAAGKSAVKTAAANHVHDHDHDHDHTHDHGHDHAHCDHDHEQEQESLTMAGDHEHFHDHQGHDHGWAPWRFALLIVPVVLFLLGLPAEGGMNVKGQRDESGGIGDVGQSANKGSNFRIGFNQLEKATRNADFRDNIAGTTVQLTGQYLGDRQDRFSLVRYKINCCAADAIALKAIIMMDPKKAGEYSVDPATYSNKWVQVTGRLEFAQNGKTREWMAVILLEPSKEHPVSEVVKEVPPDSNPYAYD